MSYAVYCLEKKRDPLTLYPLCPLFFSFYFTVLRPPRFTLFPYTTLFRSQSISSDVAVIRRIRQFADSDAVEHNPEDSPVRVHAGESSGLCSTASESANRSEEHTSELQSPDHVVCRLLLGKKKRPTYTLSALPTLFFVLFYRPSATEIYSLSLHDALPISEYFFRRRRNPAHPAIRRFRRCRAQSRRLSCTCSRWRVFWIVLDSVGIGE